MKKLTKKDEKEALKAYKKAYPKNLVSSVVNQANLEFQKVNQKIEEYEKYIVELRIKLDEYRYIAENPRRYLTGIMIYDELVAKGVDNAIDVTIETLKQYNFDDLQGGE